MSLLRRFEAIESRIVSLACPRERASRDDALRLRRCLHTSNTRSSNFTPPCLAPLTPRTVRYEEGISHEGWEGKHTSVDREDKRVSGDNPLLAWPGVMKPHPPPVQDIWADASTNKDLPETKPKEVGNFVAWEPIHDPHPLLNHEGIYPPQPYNAEAWLEPSRLTEQDPPKISKFSGFKTQPKRRKHKSLKRLYKLVGVAMPGPKEEAFEAAGTLDVVSVPSTDHRDKVPKEFHIRLIYKALAKKDPHSLLYVLLRAIHFGKDEPILASIPPDTFTEILRLLHPKHFIRRYRSLHKEVNSYEWAQLGLPGREMHDYHRFCHRFLHQITNVIQSRSKWGLSSEDYRYLLKCCRETGNVRLAGKFWRELVASREPLDVTCFNDYLAAKCWTEQTNPDQRERLRILPQNTEPRYWKNPPLTLSGHVLGGPEAIKQTVARVFQQMVEAGVSGNEETFCLMIIALARSGDLAGVGSILKRIWGIDVEGIWTKNESELPPPKQYHASSSFHPSEELLVAVTHAYGINNSVPIALRIVDYISRHYQVTIPGRVWRDLMEHTSELSLRRSTEKLEKLGLTNAQLPIEAISNLWATMTSPPYNIKPDMAMYNLLVKNCLSRSRFGEVKRYMEGGRALHHKLVADLQLRIIAARRSSRNQLFPQVLTKAQRDLAYHYLKVRRSRLYIRYWVKYWIWQGSVSLKTNETFGTIDLQRFMIVWKLFLPHKVKYRLSTGSVEFVTDSRAANRKSRKRLMAIMRRHELAELGTQRISRIGATLKGSRLRSALPMIRQRSASSSG